MEESLGVTSGGNFADTNDSSSNFLCLGTPLMSKAADRPVAVVHLSASSFSISDSRQSGASLTCMPSSAIGTKRVGDREVFHVS